jgi:micrococcal nuclease
MYEYRARIVRVIDGDTVEAEVDLGFHICSRMRLRLFGINAPEIKGPTRPAGLAARDYLNHLIQTHTDSTSQLTIRTLKDATEKYGRCLATLVASNRNLNEAMIAAGHAVVAMYE